MNSLDPMTVILTTFAGVFASLMLGAILYAIIGGIVGVVLASFVSFIGTMWVVKIMMNLLKQ